MRTAYTNTIYEQDRYRFEIRLGLLMSNVVLCVIENNCIVKLYMSQYARVCHCLYFVKLDSLCACIFCKAILSLFRMET